MDSLMEIVMTVTQFVTRPCDHTNPTRFADRKLIKPLIVGIPTMHSVGGLVVLKDKVFAFASRSQTHTLIQDRIANIISRADAYAWGATKMEALAKIRPHLDGADPEYRPGDTFKSKRETVAIGDFGTMIALFDKAKADRKGAPYAKILCEDMTVKLSVSKPGTTAPGTINVSTGSGETNRWFGRITKNGEFEVNPRETLPSSLKLTLLDFAANPQAAMINYGRMTGSCAICSRKLTDPVSVERGIGPICESRFFG